MILSQGEKMIWAVAFTNYLVHSIQNPPDCVTATKALRETYEKSSAVNSAKMAHEAIIRFRESLYGIEKCFGEDSDVYEMALAMLGKEE